MSETLVHTATAGVSAHDASLKPEVISRATLDAGQTHEVLLGLYENSFPEPQLDIDVQPGIAKVQVSLLRTPQNGDYILSYSLKNLWDQSCNVVVRMTPAA
ncbi:MAG TPA: hypothetical protein VJ843_04720 [Candidatus Saccharimonadales bacterium]|nr:hypothetical protein [Candidatus Saccharimonadales bacterium]